MDEAELQEAVGLALEAIGTDVVELAAEVARDPMLAASQMKKLADAIIKLGGGTVRPRTRTLRL